MSHKEGMLTFFGPAIGAGYKFLLSDLLPLEIYADIGKDLVNPQFLIPIVYDAGICIGLRF